MLLRLILALCLSAACSAFARDDIRIGMALEPPGLDPTRTAAASAGEIGYCNLFEGLTAIDAQGRLQPRLARRWSVSDDGLRYEFDLRYGVFFHDGKPFSAQTAAFSLERLLRPESRNPQRDWFAKVRAVEVMGPGRLAIVLSQPDAMLPFALALPAAVMVHPDSVANNALHPTGTGPFRFAEWRRGSWVQLDRNEDYWGEVAALRSARFLFLHTTAEADRLLAEGRLDVLLNTTRLAQHFESRPDYHLATRAVEGKLILAINNARKPFKDLRVRRALAHAINRARLRVLYGEQQPSEPIGSHFSPSHPAYIDLTQRYPYDPKKARALLAEARVPRKLRVTLKLPRTDYGRYGGLLIASDLEAVGLRVDLLTLDWPQWMSEVFEQKNYDLTLTMHVEPLDIGIYARDDYYFNYDNAGFKPIWQRVLAARSETELNRRLGDAQRRITEDAVNVFLLQRPGTSLVHSRLAGTGDRSPIPSFVLENLRWLDAAPQPARR